MSKIGKSNKCLMYKLWNVIAKCPQDTCIHYWSHACWQLGKGQENSFIYFSAIISEKQEQFRLARKKTQKNNYQYRYGSLGCGWGILLPLPWLVMPYDYPNLYSKTDTNKTDIWSVYFDDHAFCICIYNSNYLSISKK